MPDAWRAGAWPKAAPLVLAAVLASGCISSSHSTGPTAAITSAAPVPSASPSAERVIHEALVATGKVRSYRFHATTTVAARQAVRTVIAGSVVRGEGLSYRLTAAGVSSRVVRTPHGTYVRPRSGHWAKLRHRRPTVNPSASLRAVLRGLTATQVSAAGSGGHRVQGTLAPAAARAAGIPTDRRPADVVVTLDRHARVVALTISTSTSAGTHSVTVTVHSTYGGFDRVARIRAPI